jgi:hypothetical protein
MPDHIRTHPAALAFTSTAQRFCALLEHPINDRDLWLADLSRCLATLYAAAPVLRDINPAGLPATAHDIPHSFKLTNDEWNALYLHLKNSLGNLAAYPATTPDGHPTTGDLADDFADIYRDLKPGLSAWNTLDDTYLHDVLFQWLEFGHPHHWGPHALNALRALHPLIYK